MYKKTLSGLKTAWIISIVFSVIVRIPNLHELAYAWRPIQTEMTAYWFMKEGVNLVNYQTPLYGPPWQVPFEFPLFQATAAIISRAGLGTFDFACRLTALFYFYLSAVFLYLICKKMFAHNPTNFAIITIYLWLPYNIYYSTEPLIDYLALGLALAYLYFILLWLETQPSLRHALAATICGSLGILVKPTTTPIVAIPIIAFVLKDILSIYSADFTRSFNLRFVLNKIWGQRGYWLTLIGMAIIPVLMGSAWTRLTDHIKYGSIFTQWLTSNALVNWNFGTWELRTNQNVWIDYISTAQRFLLPYGLTIFASLGFFAAVGITKDTQEKKEIHLFVISILVSIAVVLATFLNLYLHQYYYISLSASMSIIGGYGLARFWQLKQKNQHILTVVFASWAIIFLVFNIKDYKMFRNIAIHENQKMQQAIAWSKKVQQYIPIDKWVVVVESDWNPTYVYPLERKAMVVTPRELGKPLCQILADERFTLVVVGDLEYDENEKLLEYTFKCFKSTEEVMPGVYLVKH